MKNTKHADVRELTFHDQVKTDCWGMTDIGKHRDSNQDQFLVADLHKHMSVECSSVSFQPPQVYGDALGKLMLVADGIGGENAGEVASKLATRSTADYLLNSMHWLFHPTEPEIDNFVEDLKKAACFTHSVVRNDGVETPRHRGMGTTLTVAWVAWPILHVLHVGDSRCYLRHGGKLNLLTRDQTLAQHLYDRGDIDDEQLRESPLHHVLTSAIGIDGQPEAVVYRHRLEIGDRLLLCTDGVNKHLNDNEIGDLLNSESEAREICDQIVSLANERGGRDNITVVVVKFQDLLPIVRSDRVDSLQH